MIYHSIGMHVWPHTIFFILRFCSSKIKWTLDLSEALYAFAI